MERIVLEVNDELARAWRSGKPWTPGIITTHHIKRELADVFLRSKFDKYVSFDKRVQLLDLLERQVIKIC